MPFTSSTIKPDSIQSMHSLDWLNNPESSQSISTFQNLASQKKTNALYSAKTWRRFSWGFEIIRSDYAKQQFHSYKPQHPIWLAKHAQTIEGPLIWLEEFPPVQNIVYFEVH